MGAEDNMRATASEAGRRMDLAAVIPVLNGGEALKATLAAVAPVAAVVVVDGGSSDDSVAVAKAAGARVIDSPTGRGRQLSAGAEASEAAWLLFLHADTILPPNARNAIAAHMDRHPDGAVAGYFRLAFDDGGAGARRVASLANWRARRLGLPYGDQGLLIHRSLYRDIGGFRPLPLMEDVDIARRIGRARLRALDATVTTSAARYRRDGWLCRPARNLTCLALYYLGVPPARIAKLYG